MDPVTFIRESCEIQGATTPEDLIGMTRAYDYAVERSWRFDQNGGIRVQLSDLSSFICYIRNNPVWVEFRDLPVTLPNCNVIPGGRDEILRQLKNLFAAIKNLTPTEFYWAFEEIHPWDDGNGRVGTLIFNLLNNTISAPVHPPENPKWRADLPAGLLKRSGIHAITMSLPSPEKLQSFLDNGWKPYYLKD